MAMAFDFSEMFRGGEQLDFSASRSVKKPFKKHLRTSATDRLTPPYSPVVAVDHDEDKLCENNQLADPSAMLVFSPGRNHRVSSQPVGMALTLPSTSPFRAASTLEERARIARSMVAEQLGQDSIEDLEFVSTEPTKYTEKVIDCVIALVLALRKGHDKLNKVQDEVSKTSLELDNCRRQRDVARQRITQLDQAKAGLENKISHQAALHKRELSKIVRDKNKLFVDCNKLTALQNKFKANLRRKEVEFSRLQSRLQRIHSSRNREMKDCFEIAKNKQLQAQKEASALNSEPVVAKTVYLETLEENAKLRDAINQLRAKVDDAFVTDDDTENSMSSDTKANVIVVPGASSLEKDNEFGLEINIGAAPSKMVCKYLVSDIQEKVKKILQQKRSKQSHKKTDELREALAIIRAQDALLQQYCRRFKQKDNFEENGDKLSQASDSDLASFIASRRDQIKEDTMRLKIAQDRIRKEQEQLIEDRKLLDKERFAVQRLKLSALEWTPERSTKTTSHLGATPATKALLERVLKSEDSPIIESSILRTSNSVNSPGLLNTPVKTDCWPVSPISDGTPKSNAVTTNS